MLKVFGIPNCDQVKKAQNWLRDHNIEFEFHNYREQGISKKLLTDWCKTVDWETLLNKRSRTWKELSKKDQSKLSQVKAITLMQKHPTLIKRPIVQKGKMIEVGFNNKSYIKKFI